MSDILLSDDEIDRLIKIPKRIIQQPYKEDKQEKQHHRNDMKLLSFDGRDSFAVFFRRHSLFIESFSIGLTYTPNALKGKVTLFRCNGEHGMTRLWDHHKTPHIHRVTAKDLQECRNTESEITPTTAYYTYEQAVIFFAKQCNITEHCDYINKFRQLSLLQPWKQNNS